MAVSDWLIFAGDPVAGCLFFYPTSQTQGNELTRLP